MKRICHLLLIFVHLGTNFNSAVLEGITLLENHNRIVGNQVEGTNAVFVLTDGNPTAGLVEKLKHFLLYYRVLGVTDKYLIRRNIREANAGKNSPVFTIGFGHDVDAVFLQQIAEENSGKSQ